MTYDQYWKEDPALVLDYLEAFNLQRKRRNEEMWLQGLYVYKAIGSFAEVFVGLPAKGAKIREYEKEPIPLTREEMEMRIERNKKKKFDEIMEKMLSISKVKPKVDERSD